eukprot:jgi/Mesen1/6865/ME000351S05980
MVSAALARGAFCLGLSVHPPFQLVVSRLPSTRISTQGRQITAYNRLGIGCLQTALITKSLPRRISSAVPPPDGVAFPMQIPCTKVPVSNGRNFTIKSRKGGEGGESQSVSTKAGSSDASWLRTSMEELLTTQSGCERDLARQISTACGDACETLLGGGSGGFDPLMLMDAMEEEIERRDLRGEFLPMELGQMAARLLGQRWASPDKKPARYEQNLRENTLDIVSLENLPKPELPPEMRIE